MQNAKCKVQNYDEKGYGDYTESGKRFLTKKIR